MSRNSCERREDYSCGQDVPRYILRSSRRNETIPRRATGETPASPSSGELKPTTGRNSGPRYYGWSLNWRDFQTIAARGTAEGR